jgi:hypothetical protein
MGAGADGLGAGEVAHAEATVTTDDITCRETTATDRERFIAAAIKTFCWTAEDAGHVFDQLQVAPEAFVEALEELCDRVVASADRKPEDT